MSIVLAILKIIGIVLLVILGIVLLLLLLIMFVPIKYKILGVHNEETTNLDILANYLGIRFKANYKKGGDGFKYVLKFLFIKLKSSDDVDEDDLDELEDEGLNDYIMNPAEDGIAVQGGQTQGNIGQANLGQENLSQDSSSQDNLSQGNSGQGDSVQTTATEESVDQQSMTSQDAFDQIMPTDDEIKLSKKEQKQREKERKKALKEEKKRQKAQEPKKSIDDKIDELLKKIDDKLDNLDKIYVEKITKLDHWIQFLDKDYVRHTISMVLVILKRTLVTIKPKKSKGYLRLGLGSAADTGEVLGKISMFYPLYGRWLSIEPDFYNKIIEADVMMKGRIYLFRILFPSIKLALTRDFWKTKKLYDKI
ncbi:MAG: DUF2953 domain-containing protein [Eubacterium sp.]|nr:DUF2953 domain-containing protein [Eubacterium sp.]